MGTNCREILDAALRLSAEDRGIIAERLLETLSPESTEPSDDDIEVELEGRLEEVRSDPTATISWAALKEEG
jgi:putative addiction module component (TIGR02574 family)